jgi:hypothetical protein
MRGAHEVVVQQVKLESQSGSMADDFQRIVAVARIGFVAQSA